MDYADAELKFSELLATLLSYGRQGIPIGDECYLQLLQVAESIIESLPEEPRLQLMEHRKVELKLIRMLAAAQISASSTAA